MTVKQTDTDSQTNGLRDDVWVHDTTKGGVDKTMTMTKGVDKMTTETKGVDKKMVMLTEAISEEKMSGIRRRRQEEADKKRRR